MQAAATNPTVQPAKNTRILTTIKIALSVKDLAIQKNGAIRGH